MSPDKSQTTAPTADQWRSLAREQSKIIERLANALRSIANAPPDAPAIAREALNEDNTSIRFEERTETFGAVRLEYHPEGIFLWVGGELRWRSDRDPKLWSAKP